MRRLYFNAFLMNTASHIQHGQWRRPDARQDDFADVDADADYSVYLREGLQIPSNDPTVLLAALATQTKDIGLAVTSNTFQQHPTNFARQMATLDHISRGRVAWNIVTGTQDNGYRNFGYESLEDHG